MLILTLWQLNDKSLLKDKAYVNGEWVGARSGKTFEVHGKFALFHNACACRLTLLYRSGDSKADRYDAGDES